MITCRKLRQGANPTAPWVALDGQHGCSERRRGEGAGALAERRTDGRTGCIHLDNPYRFGTDEVVVDQAGATSNGEGAPPEGVGRCEGSVERLIGRHCSVVILVGRTRHVFASNREDATLSSLVLGTVYARKGVGKIPCRRARGLQIHASAGSCRPIKLRDERVFDVGELHGEGFGACYTQFRVVGDQGEFPLTGGVCDQRSTSDGVAGGLR